MPSLRKPKRHNNNNKTMRLKKASNKSRKMRGGFGCGKYIKEIKRLNEIIEYDNKYVKHLTDNIVSEKRPGSLRPEDESLYPTLLHLDTNSTPSYVPSSNRSVTGSIMIRYPSGSIKSGRDMVFEPKLVTPPRPFSKRSLSKHPNLKSSWRHNTAKRQSILLRNINNDGKNSATFNRRRKWKGIPKVIPNM